MDQLTKDIKSLQKEIEGKELLVKHRKVYYDLVKRYGEVANDDNTKLKDLKKVEEQVNQLHQIFNA